MLGRALYRCARIPRPTWNSVRPVRLMHILAQPSTEYHWNTPLQCRHRLLATQQQNTDVDLDSALYDRVCAETLNALSDYFEELTEAAPHLQGSDVAYGDGVLTIKLGAAHGTYVINRQTPNKQIWLSSPTSGPKRYDFVGPQTADSGKWVYKHDGETIHQLLQREIAPIMKGQVDFLQLPYSS